ncbi:MAG TPA: HD domain-containing phosphohydrolase [Bryobacteraceae bacterium]|nr:HD domain-containing phosphohydrolase [Bryobacteraceae bacterium]
MQTVRDGLRASVRDNQVALAREQARNEGRNRKLLEGIGENPSLKAGLQLLGADGGATEQARNTVQDQLSEICDSLSFDFMMVSGARGEPLAAVVRYAGGFAPVNFTRLHPPEQGFFSADGRLYEVTSVPVREAGTQVATLTVGGRFDISRFGVPAVLLHRGAVIEAQMRDLAPAQIERALAACSPAADCELRIQDQQYLSLPLGQAAGSGDESYSLRSLQSVDAASAPLQTILRKLFLVAGFIALAAMLGISALSSRSIARPLVDVVTHLRSCAATGELPEFPESRGGAHEIRDLTQGFNYAARAVRESRERLTRAYVQFVGSLAQALDARDAYTAGHSRRVSEYSCAIAKTMNLAEHDLEIIRVGALLHDLGKIGISDLVLQKPGRLTPEENELIRQHPVIGKRILENVQGLEAYLSIVELHHENLNGTGYPHGLKGEETPLYARIVKVADAYDAMTSDRPYRRGKSHAEALAVLRSVSGSEMDPAVVEAFALLGDQRKQQAALAGTQSLQSLSEAVQSEIARPVPAATAALEIVAREREAS